MPVKTPTLINIPIDANPIEKTLTLTPETPETEEDQEDDIDPNAESAVLNSGAFGCMFFPGIRCNGQLENRDYITKIQKKTHVTDNEIYISRRIRKKIRGYRNFFDPISKQCQVKMTKKYANDIRKGTLFQKEKDQELEHEPYVSNKIRYLGNETIRTYLFNIASGKVDTTEIKPMGELFWDAVIRTHLRLLTGVHLLLSAKIIHMDLKYGNIMMDPKTKQPIIIDFGISVDQKALSNAPALPVPPEGGSVTTPGITTPRSVFYVYDTYTAWCFDIFLCNYIVQVVQAKVSSQPTALDDIPTKKQLKSIMEEFQYGPVAKYAEHDKTRNDIFTTTLISTETIERFREKTIASFLSKTKTPKSWKEIYEQCIGSLYLSWDNYSIAAMYLGILDILKYSNRNAFEQIETVHTTSGKPVVEEYIQIIESVVYADPFHRPTVKETMTRLQQLRERRSKE